MSSEAALSVVGLSIDHWALEHGRAPSTTEGLGVLDLKATPLDGWERPLAYVPDAGSAKNFRLYSVGADGIDSQGDGDDIRYGST
jgi:hypothetical protein